MSATATAAGPLTSEQVAQYHADGYIVVPNLLTPVEIDWFVEYALKPRPPELQWGLRTHVVDEKYKYLATHPRMVDIVKQLLGASEPRIVQTMFLNKAAAGGKGIALHQDTHYLPTEPNTLMACWVALTDTDAGNGGFCVVPGSHKTGLRRARKNENSEQVSWEMEHEMKTRDGRAYTQKLHSFEIDGLNADEVRRLSIPAGAGIFFSGMVIHGSFENKSPNRVRSAFATHYVHEDTWVLRCDVQETVPAVP